jgi:hypothetical protein
MPISFSLPSIHIQEVCDLSRRVSEEEMRKPMDDEPNAYIIEGVNRLKKRCAEHQRGVSYRS